MMMIMMITGCGRCIEIGVHALTLIFEKTKQLWTCYQDTWHIYSKEASDYFDLSSLEWLQTFRKEYQTLTAYDTGQMVCQHLVLFCSQK